MRKALNHAFWNPKSCWRAFSLESNYLTARWLSTTRHNYLGRPVNNSRKQGQGARNAVASHDTPSATPLHNVASSPKKDSDSVKPAYARSFLFYEPRRPAVKRQLRDQNRQLKDVSPRDLTRFEKELASNPFAAILASPVRQCFYTRKSLPNAFMTKLIQAASGETSNRPWIVPEGIIPTRASTAVTHPRRFGVGKWIFSDSKIISAMVKEGKYKMINTAAFIRPDLPQLIYAQMTYRVMTDFQNLDRRAKHSLVQLDLSDKKLFDGDTTLRGRLQCVLYFPRNEQSKVSATSLADDKADTPNQHLPQLPSVLIARATAVNEIKLNTTAGLDRELISLPKYNITKLFAHYPQGLATIRQVCQRANVQLDDLQDQWVGLYELKSTIPLAIDLWKLCQMLPSSESRAK